VPRAAPRRHHHGKYSGTLGNQIQFSIQNGALANSYAAVVSFPGMVPEQFNNVPSGAVPRPPR
jgi:hypothetical protein